MRDGLDATWAIPDESQRWAQSPTDLRVYLDAKDDYIANLIEEIGLAQVRDREVSVRGEKLC